MPMPGVPAPRARDDCRRLSAPSKTRRSGWEIRSGSWSEDRAIVAACSGEEFLVFLLPPLEGLGTALEQIEDVLLNIVNRPAEWRAGPDR